MDEQTRTALRAIADSHLRLGHALEALLADDASRIPAAHAQNLGLAPLADWDPETDPPLVEPKVTGTRLEQDWCCLTYLGGIYAINRRYGRGANAAEIRKFATRAGYRDGRAVTAWSKGSGPTYNDAEKQRWITADGAQHWVRNMAAKLRVSLPSDLATPWQPEQRDRVESPEK